MTGVVRAAGTDVRRPARRWVGAMVASMLLVAACAGTAPAGGSTKPETDPAVANGKQLFSTKGCIACHVAPGVPGATGSIGPSLAGIGDPSKRPTLTDGGANTPEHVKAWI